MSDKIKVDIVIKDTYMTYCPAGKAMDTYDKISIKIEGNDKADILYIIDKIAEKKII